VTHLANTFLVSRKTILYWRNKEIYDHNQLLKIKDLVLQIRKIMPRCGSIKLYHILKFDLICEGINIGRDKFHKALKRLRLLVPRKKKFFRTTDSNHLFNKRSNLVKGMEINKPEQLWVSDLTYLKTSNGTLYLSIITDAYSKKIMGYNLADNLKAESSKYALINALKNRQYPSRKTYSSL